MADTYEKDLGQKSSLTTSDFIRVVGSDNVSYKQSMSSVAGAVVGTYTSDLGGGSNQTLASALGAVERLGNMKQINNSTDANSLTTVGSYGIQSSSSYPSNLPSGTSRGILYVLHGMGLDSNVSDVCQLFITYPAGEHYWRYYSTSSSTWTSWVKQPTRAEIDDATKHIRVNHSNIASGGTWSVALRDAGTGVYHYGLLVGGSGQSAPFLAHVFIGSGANAPVVINNILQNTFTVTGTCSNGTVTFTVNGATAYGGLRYIDLA